MFSYFTVNAANDILPAVIKRFELALTKKRETQRLAQQLESVSDMTSLEEYINLKQRLNSAMTQFYDAVESLEETGAVIKSLEQGLLDFPAKKFDEEIWLCWKHGETEIRFWHERDSGFMGRRPLEINDESLV